MTCIIAFSYAITNLQGITFLTGGVLMYQNYCNFPLTVHLTLQINGCFNFAKVCD